jgi:hypothetical protein
MSLPRFVKDKDSVLDYVVDWRKVLEDGETIDNSEWTIEDKGNADDLEQGPQGTARQDGKNLIWLAGGVVGERYEIQNRIETSEGRTYDRTFTLRIAEM